MVNKPTIVVAKLGKILQLQTSTVIAKERKRLWRSRDFDAIKIHKNKSAMHSLFGFC